MPGEEPVEHPRPIYGAEADTCCSGPAEAPGNVFLDQNGQEFVFKQAFSADEFRDLVSVSRARAQTVTLNGDYPRFGSGGEPVKTCRWERLGKKGANQRALSDGNGVARRGSRLPAGVRFFR